MSEEEHCVSEVPDGVYTGEIVSVGAHKDVWSEQKADELRFRVFDGPYAGYVVAMVLHSNSEGARKFRKMQLKCLHLSEDQFSRDPQQLMRRRVCFLAQQNKGFRQSYYIKYVLPEEGTRSS